MAKLPFITPSSVPTATKSRCLVFPDSLEWRALINGFIGMGINPYNWQQLDGGIPIEEAVEACVKILNEWFQDSECAPVSNRIVGEIAFFGTPEPPDGWLRCDWALYEKSAYPALYSAIGDAFGVSPHADQFYVPDMRYRSPIGTGELLGYVGAAQVPLGNRAGQGGVQLTEANLPAHHHQLQNNAGVPAYRHTGSSGARPSIGAANGITPSLAEMVTENTGAGVPFSIVHPVTGLTACIYAGGAV